MNKIAISFHGFPLDTSESQIIDYMKQFGEISEPKIRNDQNYIISEALITFPKNDLKELIEKINSTPFNDKKITASPKESSNPSQNQPKRPPMLFEHKEVLFPLNPIEFDNVMEGHNNGHNSHHHENEERKSERNDERRGKTSNEREERHHNHRHQRRDYEREYDRSHGREYDRSHGREYDRSHGREYDRSHGREYDRSHGREYDRSHDQRRYRSDH